MKLVRFEYDEYVKLTHGL